MKNLILLENVKKWEITVNYKLTTEEMVSAGCYDFSSPNITSINFPAPVEKIGKIERVSVNVFRFNPHAIWVDAIQYMNDMAFRPATAYELMALGVGVSDSRRKTIIPPIVAPGSTWFDGKFYAFLVFGGYDLYRRLNLLYKGRSGRVGDYRLLGVYGKESLNNKPLQLPLFTEQELI